MQKASPHARGSGFIAVALALALGLALPGTARAQSTTYTACYVPDAGAVYMIGEQDTPSSCLESSHVEFTFGGDTTGVSDHGNLSGLTDDDHPQYVLDRSDVLSVDSSWVGVNRASALTPSSAFGVRTDASSDSYGGMYVETSSQSGYPFYGYATSGDHRMWTYYDGGTGLWHVYNGDYSRLTVADDGAVAIGAGTTGPSRLSVTENGTKEGLRVEIDNASNSTNGIIVTHRGTGDLISALTRSSNASTVRFNVDNGGNVSADGDLTVGGSLNVSGSKNFRIDHPLDPSGEYLKHAAVESPNRLNTYTGNVTLDEDGEATVTLPDYFQSINRDVRYQLTPVGAAAPRLHVAEEIDGNRFRVAGGPPGTKVSWRVTGIRDDAYAREHPFRAEVEKEQEQPEP